MWTTLKQTSKVSLLLGEYQTNLKPLREKELLISPGSTLNEAPIGLSLFVVNELEVRQSLNVVGMQSVSHYWMNVLILSGTKEKELLSMGQNQTTIFT